MRCGNLGVEYQPHCPGLIIVTDLIRSRPIICPMSGKDYSDAIATALAELDATLTEVAPVSGLQSGSQFDRSKARVPLKPRLTSTSNLRTLNKETTVRYASRHGTFAVANRLWLKGLTCICCSRILAPKNAPSPGFSLGDSLIGLPQRGGALGETQGIPGTRQSEFCISRLNDYPYPTVL